MLNSKRGFTLVELLIVIAIISILAAVFIPNLLFPRARAHDTGTVTCLKEVATRQEAFASDSPFHYNTSFDPGSVDACEGVNFSDATVTHDDYRYEATHQYGANTYQVVPGTPVTKVP